MLVLASAHKVQYRDDPGYEPCCVTLTHRVSTTFLSAIEIKQMPLHVYELLLPIAETHCYRHLGFRTTCAAQPNYFAETRSKKNPNGLSRKLAINYLLDISIYKGVMIRHNETNRVSGE